MNSNSGSPVNNDEVITIPKTLVHNDIQGVEDYSFCVINTKTSDVDIYYIVQGWRWKEYNQFVKFSFPKNKELANWLVDKTDMKDVEGVIKEQLKKQQQNNQLKTAKVSYLALKNNDSKQPPFDEITIKNIKDIELNKIKEDYFSEVFFDCSDTNEIKRFSYEPIIQILYENNQKKLYEPLLKEGWYVLKGRDYNYRKQIIETFIKAGKQNLVEEMKKFDENLKTYLSEETKPLKDEIKDLSSKYEKLQQKNYKLNIEQETLMNKIVEIDNNIETAVKEAFMQYKERVKTNIIDKGSYFKKGKENSGSFFSCCGEGNNYDHINEQDVENILHADDCYQLKQEELNFEDYYAKKERKFFKKEDVENFLKNNCCNEKDVQ